MTSWVIWMASLGWASDLDGVEIPELNTQLYRMPVDSDGTLWTDTASGVGEGFLFRTGMNFAQGSMAYLPPVGDPVMVLSGSSALDVVLGYDTGRVRLAAVAPVLYTAGLDEVSGAGLGNVGVDGRLTLVEGDLGFALGGRVGLPTMTLEAPVGGSGVAGDLLAIVDASFGDVTIATNVGARLQPGTEALDQTWDDQLLVRLGATYGISDTLAMSADVGGSANLSGLGDSPGSLPLEAILGSHLHASERLAVRLGVGRGLTSGLGASQFRAVAMIDVLSGGGEREPRVRTPREKPEKTEKVRTPRDRTQEKVRDFSTSMGTRIELVDASGAPVVDAVVTGGDAKSLEDGTWSFASGQGTLNLTVRAPGYVTQRVRLEDAAGTTRVVELEKAIALRVVEVEVFGSDGRRLTGAMATAGGHTVMVPVDRPLRMALALGEQRVLVEAAGHGPAYQDVDVEKGRTHTVRLALEANQVILRPGALDLPKPLRPSDTNLQRAVIAEALVRPGIQKIRLIGDPAITSLVRQSMVALGCDDALLVEATAGAGVPPKGTFDVVVSR